ncbi:MAG TPA: hypothetical protein VGV18_09430 [Verrucomicrobiae bacterium]|nr:hypothetical protein [Verrucomicrobiae bacterium]
MLFLPHTQRRIKILKILRQPPLTEMAGTLRCLARGAATRQSWQHLCGTIADERANYDPRKRYGSYFAADRIAA